MIINKGECLSSAGFSYGLLKVNFSMRGAVRQIEVGSEA